MLREILEEREDVIVERWLDCVLAAYPADGGAVFKRLTDPFANPVGSTARDGTRALFRALRGEEATPEELVEHLEGTLRIRAVQAMPASVAVGFVMELKRLVRAELRSHGMMAADPTELRAFEDGVDRLALLAFDVYTRCREDVANVRLREANRKVDWIVDRLNGVALDEEPGDAAPEAEAGRRRDPESLSLPIVDNTRVRGGVSP